MLRIKLCPWAEPHPADIIVIMNDGNAGNGLTADSNQTVTHLWATHDDVLFFRSLSDVVPNPIPNSKTKKELLPFSPPCYTPSSGMVPCPEFLDPNPKPLSQLEKEKHLLRCGHIIRLLVEQHVDVNKKIGCLSLFDMAFDIKHWGIISLLLEHGAKCLCRERRSIKL